MILVGVVAVMLLTGKTFNFVAIVGTLGLIGMLIKNGIVLMDEITLQLNQGNRGRLRHWSIAPKAAYAL